MPFVSGPLLHTVSTILPQNPPCRGAGSVAVLPCPSKSGALLPLFQPLLKTGFPLLSEIDQERQSKVNATMIKTKNRGLAEWKATE